MDPILLRAKQVQDLPTFRRGSSTSVIDFIFCSPDLAPLISAPWTDPALLSIHLTTKPRRTSPYWRARPQLSALPAFQSHLFKALAASKSASTTDSPQEQWDAVKEVIKKVPQQIGHKRTPFLQRSLRHLQSRRTQLLRQSKASPWSRTLLLPDLLQVESSIARVQ
ncbi:hypothetical protein DM01DRAFT_1410481 [Hesseltinella vesiculosa]|uniref:Uncharacterized protein n=1 Tax=Hesseltinella vesiculosa TaxID=101127 RepID=A0A1X2G730_9FUNG|nr:hypothetical protein DM01DRAFT_1410481 [Hesseltinella vesiculosa]